MQSFNAYKRDNKQYDNIQYNNIQYDYIQYNNIPDEEVIVVER